MEEREREYTLGERLVRAVARRIPRTRAAVNLLRAKAAHFLRGAQRRLRPRRLAATARWVVSLGRQIVTLRRERRLTVGVDVTAFWESLTGVGWYLHRLLEHLAPRDDVRIRLYGISVVPSPDLASAVVELPRGPALERVLHHVPGDLLLPRGLLILLLRRLEPLLIALHGNQVLFAPNYFLPRRFLLSGGARVVTVHDLAWRKFPGTLRQETLEELSERQEHTLFEAARLITVSETVRRELVELGLAAPGRVRAIHHGPGHLARVTPGKTPPGTPPAYGLHVGTLEPRKNILGLLEAWRRLRLRTEDAPPLVLCGRLGWKSEEIRAALAGAAAEGWIVLPGYVPEEGLAALYRDASVVVFPTFYEGFGLPAVEAMWAGAPLVCSDIPVLREVAGDAAVYAPPHRPEVMAARIAEVLGDPELRRRMVERGRRRAAELSWERAASSTLEVLCEAAGEPS